MNKEILFVVARPISKSDQILVSLDIFIEANWNVYVWAFFDVPEYVSARNVQLLGPKLSFNGVPPSWLLQTRLMRSKRRLLRIPRDLFVKKAIALKNRAIRAYRIRFRRELAWFYLKSDKRITNNHFDVVVAADSFALLSSWKLVQIIKPRHARASLTHITSLLKEK